MFQQRSTDFDRKFLAIADHLRAIEKELGDLGRGAGRRASASAAAASNQISEAIGSAANELMQRFRRGQHAAVEEAANFGSGAYDTGTKLANDALARVSRQAKEQPMLTLGVALGIGILIGMASRRG